MSELFYVSCKCTNNGLTNFPCEIKEAALIETCVGYSIANELTLHLLQKIET